jgi:hypothetical protein
MSDEVFLRIYVDLGASLVKIFWVCDNDGDELRGFKTLASAVDEVTRSAYENGQFRDQTTSYVQFDDESWMVGANAINPVQSIQTLEPKTTTAIAKVLAVVGQVMREIPEGLKPTLDMHILLPLDEVDDAAELQGRLVELFYDGWGFDGTKVAMVRVKACSVHTEGYGLEKLLSKSPAGLLMFGHRDILWLHVEAKEIFASLSRSFPGMGMIELLRKTSFVFKDELRASAAIFAAGDALADKSLLKIACEKDLPRLKTALEESRRLVWRDLCRKLDQTSFKSAEQVLACGGNAYYWRSQLKELLGSRLTFGVPMIKEMQERFPTVPNNSLAYRALNAYALSTAHEGVLVDG